MHSQPSSVPQLDIGDWGLEFGELQNDWSCEGSSAVGSSGLRKKAQVTWEILGPTREAQFLVSEVLCDPRVQGTGWQVGKCQRGQEGARHWHCLSPATHAWKG